MMEIVNWLVRVEGEASEIYGSLSEVFKDEEEISSFLKRLSDEEMGHRRLMQQAADILSLKEVETAFLTLSQSTQERINDYFSECRMRIKAGEIDKADLFEFMVSIEFSEWNSLFLFVLNLLKITNPRYETGVKEINRHKREIQRFIASYAETDALIERMKFFPAIWEEKILVVDDEDMITMALQAILEGEGEVDSARNGEDGLKKLAGQDYGAILTDIDMPVLNGVEFYKKAVQIYPELKDRFLFFVGEGDNEYIKFFKENKLRYLPKPSDVAVIKKAVDDILKN